MSAVSRREQLDLKASMLFEAHELAWKGRKDASGVAQGKPRKWDSVDEHERRSWLVIAALPVMQ